VDAEWNFFATSHGKSACDGIGGTVKRLLTKASLQHPYTDAILTSEQVLKFCSGIHFINITPQAVAESEIRLEDRFANLWVGLVQDVNEEYGDYRINFMHPKTPATQLYWPDPVDKCWVEEENIICTINAPLVALSRRIRYKLTPKDHAKIAKVSAKWSGMM